MTEFVKRYYLTLLLEVAFLVACVFVYGLGPAVFALAATVAGAVLGYNYLALEVRAEMERVAAENEEQPFPFL